MCHQIHHDLQAIEINARYRRSTDVGNAVFACVDSIETRKTIYESAKDRTAFLCDGRMSAEVIRVVTCSAANGWAHYPATLFRADESFQGPCTAKSTIFTASITAGLMLEQFSRHLRRYPIDPDLQFNLLASEFNVGSPV